MKEKDFLKNNRLFSDYYLKELLLKDLIWDIDVSEDFRKIKEIYERKKDTVTVLNEPSLEDQFIRPILKILGHKWEVNPSLKNYKKPDYSFYETEEEKVKAELSKDYFGNAIAVGEVKRWERPLDKKLKDESDPFEVYSPSLQMERYLWFTEVKWGILTNGRLWRIYERGTSNKLDIYYEVDLINILENYDLEAFKYFHLFFRKEAFPDFLDKVYEESIDYAKAVGEDLKSNVYKAIRILANGFLETPGNNLSIDNLQEIYDNSLIFLYRLLFIFYAEYRGLLPLQKSMYRESYSLDSIKKEISKKIDRNKSIPILHKNYWSKIKVLFNLINIGSESYDISEDKFFVPPYNGGLFDPDKNKFLEENEVSDTFIAKVIDLLSRSTIKNEGGKAFVDYSSLDIRHLGSIYEGLLENKLKIAQEDMSAIKKGNKETWIKSEELSNRKEIDKVLKGKLYPVTDKGERKATGSYYTPDYIVKYIVENIIGPLIEEKKNRIEREEDLIDEILSLKILDPAMGSGHFLVEATDFIARSLVVALGGSPKEDEEEDIRWARREVVEKCIYGVDLNPLAVELAKLSLWLSTVSKDKPLSFLDYHLKCGNSLMGAKIRDLGKLPDVKRKRITTKEKAIQLSLYEQSLKKRLPIVLSDVIKILKEPSDKVEQIKEKENIYNKILGVLIPFKDVANIWISSYFDNNNIEYEWMLGLLETSGRWKELKQKEWFKITSDINKEKKFFHWELEFPEIFFDEYGREKDNQGFDVVIGNPPWVTLRRSEIGEGNWNYYRNNFFSIRVFKVNTFPMFIEQSIRLINSIGKIGLIIPNRLLDTPSYKLLRKDLVTNAMVTEIVNIPKGSFDNVIAGNILLFLDRKKKKSFLVRRNMFQERVTQSTEKRFFTNINKEEYVINLNIKERTIKLTNKIESDSEKIKNLFDVHVGIMIKDKFNQFFERRIRGSSPIVMGRDFNRFTELSIRYIKLSDVTIFGGTKSPKKHLIKPKLIVRKTGNQLISTIDNQGVFSEQSVYFIIPKKPINLNYVCGIINSSLINFYFRNKLITNPESYPYIQHYDLERIPIRKIDMTKLAEKRLHDKLVSLIDFILGLNKKIQSAKGGKKEQIQLQIEKTGKKINKLVYEIYELTYKEIKIIEES